MSEYDSTNNSIDRTRSRRAKGIRLNGRAAMEMLGVCRCEEVERRLSFTATLATPGRGGLARKKKRVNFQYKL